MGKPKPHGSFQWSDKPLRKQHNKLARIHSTRNPANKHLLELLNLSESILNAVPSLGSAALVAAAETSNIFKSPSSSASLYSFTAKGTTHP